MRKRRPKKSSIEVRGEVVSGILQEVKPNPWNPNTMTDAMKESLVYGLKNDGWLASQSLLIWGTDDIGDRQDIIIDGEHRWRAATEDGMLEGPMVFMDGLSKLEAKALTIKMNQKRGDWDPELLAAVVKELELDLDSEDLVLDLGLSSVEMDRLAGVAEVTGGATDPNAEWTGMPEFNQPDATSFRAMIVHFKDQAAVDAFSKLIGQTFTPKTKSIWHPKVEIERYADKRYSSDEGASK